MSTCGATALTSLFAQPGRRMIAVYGVLGLTILLGVVSILWVTIEYGVTSAYYWRLAANSGHYSNQIWGATSLSLLFRLNRGRSIFGGKSRPLSTSSPRSLS